MIRFTRPLKASKLMGPACPASPSHVIIPGMDGEVMDELFTGT